MGVMFKLLTDQKPPVSQPRVSRSLFELLVNVPWIGKGEASLF
jgi:hypothetical protein